MTYTLSIDWLALFCQCEAGMFFKAEDLKSVHCGQHSWEDGEFRSNMQYMEALPWSYELAEHGTRQYKQLWTIFLQREEVAFVQAQPCSQILQANSCIVKFSNRLLYRHDLWDIVNRFLFDHLITPLNISRLDLCADFNKFASYECVPFIADFLSSKLRHKGQGIGAAYFQHYTIPSGVSRVQRVKYTGLSFGSHESEARVYLYNKTLELQTKDKPYIRDLWRTGGLNLSKDVWRLEVSLKSGATKFRDRKSGEDVQIDFEGIKKSCNLSIFYHTFVRKLFSFVYNREGITNISREPIIELFNGEPFYDRQIIRNVSGSNRMDKIFIKQLWLMSQKYRSNGCVADEDLGRMLSTEVSESTDLTRWFLFKRDWWTSHLKN